MNIVTNLHFPELLGRVPVLGLSVWVVLFCNRAVAAADWNVLPETFKGTIFLLALVTAASMMPVETLPARILADRVRSRRCLRSVRQHSAHGARA